MSIRVTALRSRVQQVVNEAQSNSRVVNAFESSLDIREMENSTETFERIIEQDEVDHKI